MTLRALVALALGSAMAVLACSGAQRAPCPPSPAPTPSAAVVGAPQMATLPDESPLAALHQPPPFPAEVVAEQVDRLTEGTDLAAIPARPAVGETGELLVVPDPRRVAMSQSDLVTATLSRDAGEGAAGRRVQSHQRVFARVPTATMDRQGQVVVQFATTTDAPGVGAYYGTVMPGGAIPVVRYRKQTLQVSSGEDRAYSIEIPATSLLAERYDVHGTRHTGRGWVAWRVEVLEAARGSSRVYDGVTPFRCEPVPCGKQASFVQLPAFRLAPQVDLVGVDRATVSFSTDAATRAVVIAQADGDDVRRFPSETTGTRHEIDLVGLAADTRYRYQVLVIDRRGEVGVGRSATFRTAPETKDFDVPVTFVALSDARSAFGSTDARYAGTNMLVLRQLLERGLAHDPRFVLFVGDLVDGYTTEPGSFSFELEAWVHAVAPYGAFVPIYEAMGNHEALVEAWEAGWAVGRTGDESAEALFAEYVVNPRNAPEPASGAPPYAENVYSFDYGLVHVAIVNSNYWWRSHPDRSDHPAQPRGQREGWVNDAMLRWLDSDLGAARRRGAHYLFVGTHEPGFPNGGHTSDAMYWRGEIPEVLEQRDKLFRVLGRHRVSVLICGDEHNYSRTRVDSGLVPGMEAPVWQIVSGGAGAPYYAQERGVPWLDHVVSFDVRQHFVAVTASADRAQGEVVALSGEVIDRFELAPLPY